MLAYRHAFHAGNHADVLKHLVLMRTVALLQRKDKGLRLVDTHAGAGGYALDGRYAQQKAEAVGGVARLWTDGGQPAADWPAAVLPLVQPYLDAVLALNPDGRLVQYPGSPTLLHAALRPQDELRLFELHPTDHKILHAWLGEQPRVQVADRDGFESLRSLLPPPTRRGMVLMDPSYEGDADYGRVIASLREALQRFPDAVVLVWYPIVQKVQARQLPRRLQGVAPKSWLDASLTVAPADERGFGLMGSGMFVINPPWPLEDDLRHLLPWLAGVLSQIDDPGWKVEVHRV
jgi:23S rRNA (adenine2030-N6)-methyltransferase